MLVRHKIDRNHDSPAAKKDDRVGTFQFADRRPTYFQTLQLQGMMQRRHDSTRAHETQSSDRSAVVQLAPADWARNEWIVHALTLPHGHFSTWKEIKELIAGYNNTDAADHALRREKLGLISSHVEVWLTKHPRPPANQEKSWFGFVNKERDRVEEIRETIYAMKKIINRELREVAIPDGNPTPLPPKSYVLVGNPDVWIEVEDRNQCLEIVSNRRAISGYLKYRFVNNQLSLKSFATSPEGMGLGSILLNELAAIALSKNSPKIAVETPAYSAMRGYAHFGGFPDNEARFQTLKNFYLKQMEADGDESYESFLKTELDALGKGLASKLQFDNPNITPGKIATELATLADDHKHNYVKTANNVDMVAGLKALAMHLQYDSANLMARTAGMIPRKWTRQ